MLALRIARNLSRSAPAAVNAGVSRAFASSRIAANEAGAGEGDPVKDVFTRVQRDFRRLMDATPGVKVPVGGSEEEIAKFAWKRYDAAYEVRARDVETRRARGRATPAFARSSVRSVVIARRFRRPPS